MMSERELEEFERKTTQVADLVAGLKEGRIRPDEIKIPGEKTEEEIEKEKEAARKKKLKEVEAERKDWWGRAEGLLGKERQTAEVERLKHVKALFLNGENSTAPDKRESEKSIVITDDDGIVIFPKPKAKVDVLDYSVWDKWVPDDPVSLQEMQRAKDKIEEERNAAFEASNPEFCEQFKKDQMERNKSTAIKEREADKLRKRGNHFVKLKDLEQAMICYRDALKSVPWLQPVLCNMSYVSLKQGNMDQALEFAERALFLNPDNVKALWRRAQVCLSADRIEDAIYDLYYASLLDPNNSEVVELLQGSIQDKQEEKAERFVKINLFRDKDHVKTSHEDRETLASLENLRSCKSLWNQISQDNDFQGTLDMVVVNKLFKNLEDKSYQHQHSELLVIARETGGLEKLCDCVSRGSITETSAYDLVGICCSGSKKNMEIFHNNKVLENAQKQGNLSLLASIAEYFPSFRPQIAQDEATLLLVKENITNCASSAHLLNNLCTISKSQEYVASFVTSEKGKNFIPRLEQALKNPDIQANCCAALANLCQNALVRKLVDGPGLAKICLSTPYDQQPRDSVSLLLAALINISLEVDSATRKALGESAELLDSLLLLTVCTHNRPMVVRRRAAALLSRVLADSSLGACKLLYKKRPKVLDTLCKLADNNNDQVLEQHLVRCIAGILRSGTTKTSSGSVNILRKFLEKTAADCSKLSKEDQIGANLTQCWITLTSDPEICADQSISGKIIPALVKILQMAPDGPVRKNAAICVAKLAKSGPKNLEAVRDLRGMEMLIELGDNLLHL